MKGQSMDGLDAAAAPEAVAPDQTDAVTTGAPEGTSTESTPPAEQDLFAPAPELPEGQELTAEWLQERHKQMQADYTRKRQADAETARQRTEDLEFIDALRQDPDTQRAVFEQLQEMLAAETEDPENAAPQEAPLERQVRELREAQQAREAQELAGQIVSHLDQLQKSANVTLDEQDLRQVFEQATREGVGKDKTEKAFQAHVAREKAKQEQWLKSYLDSKKAPQQVPPGTTATEKPNLSDADTRIARMAAILTGAG